MSSVSFVGLGGTARAIADRAVAGGNAVQRIGRDAAKAKGAVPVVAKSGDALAGKVMIDISNTFNADATGLVTPDGTSGAQEIARAVPASAHVVKASSSPLLPHNSNEGCTT